MCPHFLKTVPLHCSPPVSYTHLDVYKRQQYAQMRRKFLKEHHKIRYYNLLTSCTLTQHLAETEQTALRLEETMIKQMAAQEGLSLIHIYKIQSFLCLL